MKEYFLTIRKHQVKDYVTKEDLDHILICLKLRLPLKVSDVTYEMDNKYGQLHSHIILSTLRSVYYKKHSSINGFRVYWRLINEKEPTYNYMYKDSVNKFDQEQILITNYYRHNYGFTN